jgi:hypothetical protein
MFVAMFVAMLVAMYVNVIKSPLHSDPSNGDPQWDHAAYY